MVKKVTGSDKNKPKSTSGEGKTTAKPSQPKPKKPAPPQEGPKITASPRDPRGGIYDPNYGQGRTIYTVGSDNSQSAPLPPAWSSQTPGQFMPRPGSIAGRYMS
jgi:hypothetical protein